MGVDIEPKLGGPKTGPLRGPGLFGLGPLDRKVRFCSFGLFGLPL